MMDSKKTVLIVDDDSRNIFALSAVLIPRGFNCIAALNSAQCMKILGEHTPIDVILMDIMMPEVDGIETIKMVKAMPEYSKTKIVVVTADDSAMTKLRSMAAGATGFLNKPVDINKLETLLA